LANAPSPHGQQYKPYRRVVQKNYKLKIIKVAASGLPCRCGAPRQRRGRRSARSGDEPGSCRASSSQFCARKSLVGQQQQQADKKKKKKKKEKKGTRTIKKANKRTGGTTDRKQTSFKRTLSSDTAAAVSSFSPALTAWPSDLCPPIPFSWLSLYSLCACQRHGRDCERSSECSCRGSPMTRISQQIKAVGALWPRSIRVTASSAAPSEKSLLRALLRSRFVSRFRS
jgi:hypothetical protein